jgi:hypothetical protein
MQSEHVIFAFDDRLVPFTRNLRLTLNKPEKHGANPVLARGTRGDPDEFGVQFYGSVLRDKGRFRMWYVAVDPELPARPDSPHVWRAAYAESDDGMTWMKPDLGLVDYGGNRHNNLVYIAPAPLSMINLKVLFDPHDRDANRRYKMTAHTWWAENGKKGRGTLCPLVSPDGLRWRLAVEAVPQGGMLPVENIVLPPHHFEAAGGLYRWKGVYYASGQSGPPQLHDPREYCGREVMMHRSPDFVRWSETASVGFLRSNQRTQSFRYTEGEETHEGVSVWHRGNVLLGIYGIWHGGPAWADRTIDLGFLVSNDGIHFREPVPEAIWLERGRDGDWDQGGLIQGQGFANVRDRTFIYYGAWDPRPGPDNYQPRGGVGLATLGRDRFGYLSARESPSDVRPCSFPPSLVTATIPLRRAEDLFVNADGLSASAPLTFELLTETERPIERFAGRASGIAAENGFRSPVLWDSRAASDVLDEPVRVKVTFPSGRLARLYAIYFDGDRIADRDRMRQQTSKGSR